MKVNPAKESFPDSVVTLTLPVAPAPTTATTVLSFKTLKLAASVPPNLTLVK